jgi:hypothetical protein
MKMRKKLLHAKFSKMLKKKHGWMMLSVFVLMLNVAPGYSQTADDEEEELEWIEMMDDPDVNYFEAVKAYNEWKLEEEEEEEEGQSEQEKEENEKHPVEQKKFRRWRDEMYPFVQADGSILSEKTRRQILKKVKH